MFSNTPAAPPPVHKYSSQTTNNSAFNTIMLHKLFNKLRLLNVNPQMCRLIDLGFPSQPDSGSQIQLSLSATTTLDAKYWCTSRVCFLPYCSCSSPTTADPTAAPLWYLSFQMVPPLKDWYPMLTSQPTEKKLTGGWLVHQQWPRAERGKVKGMIIDLYQEELEQDSYDTIN